MHVYVFSPETVKVRSYCHPFFKMRYFRSCVLLIKLCRKKPNCIIQTASETNRTRFLSNISSTVGVIQPWEKCLSSCDWGKHGGFTGRFCGLWGEIPAPQPEHLDGGLSDICCSGWVTPQRLLTDFNGFMTSAAGNDPIIRAIITSLIPNHFIDGARSSFSDLELFISIKVKPVGGEKRNEHKHSHLFCNLLLSLPHHRWSE